MFTVRRGAAALIIASALALAACADAQQTSSATSTSGVVVSDAFVKSTDPMTMESMSSDSMSEESGDAMAMGPMTGAFMTLTNNGDSDVSLVGGSTPVAGIVEIHEVVDGLMQPKAGGVVIPAGGTAMLEPGADHMMLMYLSGALEPGDEVQITLEFSDGSTQTILAPVKMVNTEQEHYHDPGTDK